MASPVINILHEYGIFVTANEPILLATSLLTKWYIQLSLVFTCGLFFSVSGSHPGHHNAFILLSP